MSRPRIPVRRALLLFSLLMLLAPEAGAAPARRARVRKAAPRAPAVAVSAPAPPGPDAWHRARALADAGSPDSALAVTRAALRAEPRSFELRWLEAGLVGETGDHAGAVTFYEHLGREFPDHAGDVLADLARERQRSGAPLAAIRDYRRWLVAHPDDRDARLRVARCWAEADSLHQALAAYDTLLAQDSTDTGVALARAQVLGWMGRHAEAIRAYSAVLARDPGNVTARTGLAMNENWAGRHRLAARRLEDLLREPGADPELRKTLAFARYWDDDPDAAKHELEGYLAAAPADSEAARLLRRIARERASRMSVGFGRADDSDGLRVDAPWAEVTWSPWARTGALLGWRQGEARDAGGLRRLARWSAGLSHRLDARWSVHAQQSWAAWGDSAGTRPGGEIGIVHRPSERLRLEAVVAREPVITRLALLNGITRLDWIAAVDLRASDRLRLHTDARAGYWSDGNRSERVAASARYRVLARRHGEASVGLAGEQLNTHQDLDHGYYDPDFHLEWGPRLDLSWTPDAYWTLGAGTHVGWQRDKGSNAEPFYNLSGRIEWSPDEWWSVAFESGRGDSNLQSAGGYQRRWWELSVSRGF